MTVKIKMVYSINTLSLKNCVMLPNVKYLLLTVYFIWKCLHAFTLESFCPYKPDSHCVSWAKAKGGHCGQLARGGQSSKQFSFPWSSSGEVCKIPSCLPIPPLGDLLLTKPWWSLSQCKGTQGYPFQVTSMVLKLHLLFTSHTQQDCKTTS